MRTHQERIDYQREYYITHREQYREYQKKRRKYYKKYMRRYYKNNKWRWEEYGARQTIKGAREENKCQEEL